MDRLVINSVVALGTFLSLILLVGLVELQPVEASSEGYEIPSLVAAKSTDI